MKIAYVCAKCGAQHHSEAVKQWGKTQQSAGYGPVPICTAKVKDHLGSDALCGGQLVPVQVSDADFAKLEAPTTL